MNRRIAAASLLPAAACLPPGARAAPTFSRELPTSTILAFTGLADTDPRGLACNAAGTIWYFFEDDTLDAVLRWNGTALSTWTTRAQLESALGVTGISLHDMTCDPATGTLYALVRPTSDTIERVVRLPAAGVVERVIPPSHSEGISAIDVDPANGRLVFVRTAFEGASAPEVGVWHVPLGATDGVPVQLAGQAALAAALTPPAALFEPSDLVVQSDGDVILINAFATGDVSTDGDMLRVTAAGTVSFFADRSLLLSAMGSPGGAIGDTYLECNAADEILVWHNGSAAPGEYLLKLAPDGSAAAPLASEAAMLSWPAFSGAADTGSDANGFAATADGRFGIAHNAAGTEGIIVISGTDVARVGEWPDY